MEKKTQVYVEQDSKILIPNGTHQNFTESGKVIPKGSKLEGVHIAINGMRKGEPFQYKLFKIANTNQYIYQKFIKPLENMENKTEVTLGADAEVSPTTVKIPNNIVANQTPIIGAVLGGIFGWGVSRYQKEETNKKWIYVGVGAFGGFLIGRMIVTRKKITVKEGK